MMVHPAILTLFLNCLHVHVPYKPSPLTHVPAIWLEGCFELWAIEQVLGQLLSAPTFERFDHM